MPFVNVIKKAVNLSIIFVFSTMCVLPSGVNAQSILHLPAPGTMLSSSAAHVPVIMRGVQIQPDNPLMFDFIIDSGESGMSIDSAEFKDESQKLVKYFLAALAIKEEDMWVNLSPYEQDRIIPDALEETTLGRDMLAQDYLLKQLASSSIHPDGELGKAFWDRVYEKAQEKFGTTDIPMDTFNKVWVVAEKAKVLERNNTAYVVGAHLKVLTEHDYVAAQQTNDNRQMINDHSAEPNGKSMVTGQVSVVSDKDDLSSKVMRDIVIPEIQKEVNEGAHFAPLRQMYYAMILASWYKVSIKNALLNEVYSNQEKTGGVLNNDPAMKEKIYQQYVEAYKTGAFNFIREDVDVATGKPMPRKYFSGGKVLSLQLGRNLAIAQDRALDDGPLRVGDLAMTSVSIFAAEEEGEEGVSNLERGLALINQAGEREAQEREALMAEALPFFERAIQDDGERENIVALAVVASQFAEDPDVSERVRNAMRLGAMASKEQEILGESFAVSFSTILFAGTLERASEEAARQFVEVIREKKPELFAADGAMTVAATHDEEKINVIVSYLESLGYGEGTRNIVRDYLRGADIMESLDRLGASEDNNLDGMMDMRAQWLLHAAWVSASYDLNQVDLDFLIHGLDQVRPHYDYRGSLRGVEEGSVDSKETAEEIANTLKVLWDIFQKRGRIRDLESQVISMSEEATDVENELATLRRDLQLDLFALPVLPTRNERVSRAIAEDVDEAKKTAVKDEVVRLAIAYGITQKSNQDEVVHFLSYGGSFDELAEKLQEFTIFKGSRYDAKAVLVSLWFYAYLRALPEAEATGEWFRVEDRKQGQSDDEFMKEAAEVMQSDVAAWLDRDNPGFGSIIESSWGHLIMQSNIDSLDIASRLLAMYHGYSYRWDWSMPFVNADKMDDSSRQEKRTVTYISGPVKGKFGEVFADESEKVFKRLLAQRVNLKERYGRVQGEDAHRISLEIKALEKKMVLFQRAFASNADAAMNAGPASPAANIVEAATRGGIDFDANKMDLDVDQDGSGIEMTLDAAMVAEFRSGNFTGVKGLIIRIVPLASPLPLLGYADGDDDVLAKVG